MKTLTKLSATEEVRQLGNEVLEDERQEKIKKEIKRLQSVLSKARLKMRKGKLKDAYILHYEVLIDRLKFN